SICIVNAHRLKRSKIPFCARLGEIVPQQELNRILNLVHVRNANETDCEVPNAADIEFRFIAQKETFVAAIILDLRIFPWPMVLPSNAVPLCNPVTCFSALYERYI